MKKYGLIIVLFVVASILVYFFSKDGNYIKSGNFYISEIVASNNYTYKDNDGEYSDYIELYNGNNYAFHTSTLLWRENNKIFFNSKCQRIHARNYLF